MPEKESVHEECLEERNMGEVVGDEGNLDSDDFRTVLSRRERKKKQRVNKNDAETEERGPSKEGRREWRRVGLNRSQHVVSTHCPECSDRSVCFGNGQPSAYLSRDNGWGSQ